MAIPDNVDDPGQTKRSGVVVLPAHVRWSSPDRSYDLDQHADLVSAYEQVLQEGTDDDVRSFIDVERLVKLWDELVLPDRVRRAWSEWLRRRRGLDLTC